MVVERVELGEKYLKIKKNIIAPENAEKVKASWNRLIGKLDQKLDQIAKAGPSYVPELSYRELELNGKLPDKTEKLFKERGCIIIRGVVEQEQALKWKQGLVEYITKHPDIGGYPGPTPSNWLVHWSKPQTEARSHPNIVKMMKLLGETWTIEDKTELVDMDSSVVYADRFRIRYPGKDVTLNLHLDSGSIERWEDPGYRNVYKEILEGNWEDWNPFLIDRRLHGKQDLYEGLSSNGSTCSTFRTLQGWLSMSDTKAGEGTIKFLPDLKYVIPYIILKTLLKDDGTVDPNNSCFDGATPGSGQFFPSEKYFPHLRHFETVVNIPYVKPGDFVLWHADLCHQVDKHHAGTGDSSVMYIAHTPLCEYNLDTLLDSRKCFTSGVKPRDYAYEYGLFDSCESKFEERGNIDDVLTHEGKQGLGLEKYETDDSKLTIGQKLIRKLANKVLEHVSVEN